MIDVNKMCQDTSSLLNSHNGTMQRCINNSHQTGQLSSTLDIPQLRQLEPFLEQMEIQVKQPQKDTQSLRILMVSGLRLTYICLSWTFSVTQSKGHSGLATFYGTGFGTCGYNDKKERKK